MIDRLLARARGGVSGALVVRGEAGIGKTAMLEYAALQAGRETTVLRADGVETESDLPFAGLHGLLRPIFRHLEELPQTQRGALAGALGLAPSSAPDRLLISAAVIALLASAAEERPVLCLVDDAQWLDLPSAEALVFTARRLQAERMAIVFGAREGEERRFEAAGLPELWLAGLPQGAAASVLAARASSAPPSVRERLLAEAHGNPLALMELPAALSEAQLAGRVPLPDAMPLSPRLEEVFRGRAAQLPQATQTGLLIAAADTSGDVPAVLRAAAGLGLPCDVLDAAEGAGLIKIAGRAFVFRHPLVRSALYQGATLTQRQRVHGALAGAFSGEENTDRRVWHQAMATLSEDEEVAAALEASARRGQLRAAHASAASAFLRAAELSSDQDRRLQRVAAAAHAAWDAGQAARAREALGRALAIATGEQRAALLRLSGVLEANTGSVREAYARLVESAETTSDPMLKLRVLYEAVITAINLGDYREAAETASRAAAVPQLTSRDRLVGAFIAGFEKQLVGAHEQAQAILSDALQLAWEFDDPYIMRWAAIAAPMAADGGAGLPYANRAVEAARSQGLLTQLGGVLEAQSVELFATSSFELAYASAEEGYRLSFEVGHGEGWHLVNMAFVEAVWGREHDARTHAEAALAIGLRVGSVLLAGVASKALGFLDLSMGRPEPAANRLLPITDPGHPSYVPDGCLLALPDAVEAAWRADRRAEAADRLAIAARWVEAAPAPGRRALVARSQALLGQRDPDEAFGQAIELAGALPSFERARTELLYGEWLRRERQRATARNHLRAAFELFQSLRAVPWAERAEAELRATGETARKRDESTVAQLTPQEIQIAGLVADGLTNKEIAARLYLSPRTVDYHLRKVFTKLGIVSRTDLVRHGLPGISEPA